MSGSRGGTMQRDSGIRVAGQRAAGVQTDKRRVERGSRDSCSTWGFALRSCSALSTDPRSSEVSVSSRRSPKGYGRSHAREGKAPMIAHERCEHRSACALCGRRRRLRVRKCAEQCNPTDMHRLQTRWHAERSESRHRLRSDDDPLQVQCLKSRELHDFVKRIVEVVGNFCPINKAEVERPKARACSEQR